MNFIRELFRWNIALHLIHLLTWPFLSVHSPFYMHLAYKLYMVVSCFLLLTVVLFSFHWRPLIILFHVHFIYTTVVSLYFYYHVHNDFSIILFPFLSYCTLMAFLFNRRVMNFVFILKKLYYRDRL
eukprot:TRINITY_DN5223_c0_g1_i1.p1 TRINITY_DN5223_c0_g1~~TRINITY_DN5223_c0_g1_i1.p1  ORF type:complete len:126 (+),score=20.24 TRINITY_DN5223_c0_g1_i1:204-581(+)